ncbi:MAG TPA: TlpA disulfide reductase family protein [Candidatus Sulfotelmatobacter sp.]|nr:TlpA disulfide reductase family protein [Candidatus Sulfotelmatobacter sp.]
MKVLPAGAKAPEIELKAADGSKFSLQTQLARGPVVLVFFKVSCPTCQYALPMYERLHQAYGSRGASLFGVSQNDAKETAAFIQEFRISFPVLLDDTRSYPVSNAYGLTNVPSIFWIAQDQMIEVSSVGWLKSDFESINRKMAEVGKVSPSVVFKPGEEVRDFRAG